MKKGLFRHEQRALLFSSSVPFSLCSFSSPSRCVSLLLEGCQSADVVPEGGGFALGLS